MTEQQHGKCTGIGCGMMRLINDVSKTNVQLRAEGEARLYCFLGVRLSAERPRGS